MLRQSIAFMLGAIAISSSAWADEQAKQDPIADLLQTQAVFEEPEPIAKIAYASTNDEDAISQLLLSANIAAVRTPVVSDVDPLGSLIGSNRLITSDDKRQQVVDTAFNYLNAPYKYGGNNALTGFDCSGLVRAVYLQAADASLPRTAAAQAAATTQINRSQLQPGDLVFFNTARRRTFSHVGIYVGDNKFIHAPRTGAQVRIEDMGQRYWTSRFTGARRVIQE